MQNKYLRRRGFTFIELSIVVVIISILIGIAVPAFLRSQQKAIAAAALANLNHIRTAQTLFRTDRQTYSPSIAALQEYLSFDASDANWTYAVTRADVESFTAIATRNADRPYAGFTISLTVDNRQVGVNPQSSLIEYRDSGGAACPTYPPD